MSSKPPSPSTDANSQSVPASPSTSDSIAAFVEAARVAPRTAPEGARGRLVFALDATMSRQPTWDLACRLQGEMFREAAAVGGLDVQLVYFRGFDECRASRWITEPDRLAGVMGRIDCRGGRTQIDRVLRHALAETRQKRVQALVFVGDAMEENVDALCASAGELALLSVPVFIFQEGPDPIAERAFREVARITRGAWGRFDPGAAQQLAALLRAVAAYASGGRAALAALSAREGGEARLLLDQMGKG